MVSHSTNLHSNNVCSSEETALWYRWQIREDAEAKELLIDMYLPYAKAISAKIFSGRLHNEIEFEEYFQFATIALLESLQRYEPGKGVRFTTFSFPRISGAILSGIEKLTEKQQQIALKKRLQKDRLSLKDEVIQPKPGNPDQLLQYLAEIGIGIALGAILDGTRMVSGEDEWQPDLNYERTELKQFRARCQHLLNELTEREKQVIQLHYFQELSFEEVARILGLSKARISQLHTQGLMRLRKIISMDIKTNVVW